MVGTWVDNKPVDDEYRSRDVMWIHEIHVFKLWFETNFQCMIISVMRAAWVLV